MSMVGAQGINVKDIQLCSDKGYYAVGQEESIPVVITFEARILIQGKRNKPSFTGWTPTTGMAMAMRQLRG